MVITREGAGMELDGMSIPATRRPVVDPAGCGDTVAAVFALCLARGQVLEEGCRLANTAAGIQVQRLGVQQITWAEIGLVDCKVADQETVIEFAGLQKEGGRRVVFANGCFDVLHAGHVELLRRAKSFGDVLIVGLNSDLSVKRLKGESRPMYGQEQRASVLAALECIDAVTVFEGEPAELVKAIRPDVMVKGEDYRGRPISGSEFASRVELVPLVDGLSSTRAIQGS